MSSVGFIDAELDFALDVVGALLHVGQIAFRRSRASIGEGSKYHEGCTVKDWDPLHSAAELLGVDVDAFHRCIVYRSMNIKGAGKSIEDIPLSCDKVNGCHLSPAAIRCCYLVRFTYCLHHGDLPPSLLSFCTVLRCHPCC